MGQQDTPGAAQEQAARSEETAMITQLPPPMARKMSPDQLPSSRGAHGDQQVASPGIRELVHAQHRRAPHSAADLPRIHIDVELNLHPCRGEESSPTLPTGAGSPYPDPS